jgi:hypothetical protein
MSRHILALSHEQRTSLDLEACAAHADTRHPRQRDTLPTPFPKAPSRGLSPYPGAPRPLALTSGGEVEGGLRWRVGATMAFSFPRALCAPPSGARGGPCYAPARLVVVAGAAPGDQDVESARFCGALPHPEQGWRSRALAG